jgi:hypothetical protein
MTKVTRDPILSQMNPVLGFRTKKYVPLICPMHAIFSAHLIAPDLFSVADT